MDEMQQTVEDFHDLLVPEALEYYLGLNEDFDMLGMDGEGGESEGDDDMDDDDDDEGEKKPKKGKKKGGAAADGDAEEGAEQKQECKQQ